MSKIERFEVNEVWAHSGIVKAGANVVVAGSSVFKGDIKANVSELIDLMNES